MIIVILGIMGGWLFWHDFGSKNAVVSSSEIFRKKDPKPGIPNANAGDEIHKDGAITVAGEKIPNELTPTEAALLLADFKSKHSGIRERVVFAQAIIKKLCELGYTQGAWDSIEKEHGNIRIVEIHAFFANAQLTNSELLNKISTSSLSDIHTSVGGFISRFNLEQYEEILSSSDFRNFLSGLNRLDSNELHIIKQNISSGLGNEIANSIFKTPDKTKSYLTIASRLNSIGILGTDRFMDLAARLGRSDPFENWGLVRDVKSQDNDVASQLRENMVRDMFNIDPPKAFSKILDDGNPEKSADIKSAVASWVNLDSKEATDWFQQKRATLNLHDSDAIAAAFSSYAGDVSEFSSAQQWAVQIQNPTLKAEVLKKIAETAAAKEEQAHGTQ